jgi:hypothetical protein
VYVTDHVLPLVEKPRYRPRAPKDIALHQMLQRAYLLTSGTTETCPSGSYAYYLLMIFDEPVSPRCASCLTTLQAIGAGATVLVVCVVRTNPPLAVDRFRRGPFTGTYSGRVERTHHFRIIPGVSTGWGEWLVEHPLSDAVPRAEAFPHPVVS